MLTIKDAEVLNINIFLDWIHNLFARKKKFGDEILKESLYETIKIIYERKINHK